MVSCFFKWGLAGVRCYIFFFLLGQQHHFQRENIILSDFLVDKLEFHAVFSLVIFTREVHSAASEYERLPRKVVFHLELKAIHLVHFNLFVLVLEHQLDSVQGLNLVVV